MDAPKRILIVDHNVELRNSLYVILHEFEGYDVFDTDDGQVGLSLVHEHAPHLIVAELATNGLNGVELFQSLRAIAEFEHIPFIFLTGFPEKDIQKWLPETAQYDYMAKPFNVDTLLALIHARLQQNA